MNQGFIDIDEWFKTHINTYKRPRQDTFKTVEEEYDYEVDDEEEREEEE